MLVGTWTLVRIEKHLPEILALYRVTYIDGYNRGNELVVAAEDELAALKQWRKHAERHHKFDGRGIKLHEATAEDTNKPCADA
jgi:hypothetical protein